MDRGRRGRFQLAYLFGAPDGLGPALRGTTFQMGGREGNRGERQSCNLGQVLHQAPASSKTGLWALYFGLPRREKARRHHRHHHRHSSIIIMPYADHHQHHQHHHCRLLSVAILLKPFSLKLFGVSASCRSRWSRTSRTCRSRWIAEAICTVRRQDAS